MKHFGDIHTLPFGLELFIRLPETKLCIIPCKLGQGVRYSEGSMVTVGVNLNLPPPDLRLTSTGVNENV